MKMKELKINALTEVKNALNSPHAKYYSSHNNLFSDF